MERKEKYSWFSRSHKWRFCGVPPAFTNRMTIAASEVCLCFESYNCQSYATCMNICISTLSAKLKTWLQPAEKAVYFCGVIARFRATRLLQSCGNRWTHRRYFFKLNPNQLLCSTLYIHKGREMSCSLRGIYMLLFLFSGALVFAITANSVLNQRNE